MARRGRTTSKAASGEGGEAARAPASNAEPPPAEFSARGASDLAAVAQANAALVEGLGEIGAAVCAYTRDSLSNAASVARSMIDARSLADVVALNHDFAQMALEGLIANSARVAEIGVRTASEALKPLGRQAAGAVSKPND